MHSFAYSQILRLADSLRMTKKTLSADMRYQIIVAAVEMLRELAGADPDEGGGKGGEEEFCNVLALFGRDLRAVLARDDQVEEVFFAFELVAVGADLASVGVGLDSDRSEGGDGGTAVVFVVGGKADLGVRFDGGADCGYDPLPLSAFFLTWLEHGRL